MSDGEKGLIDPVTGKPISKEPEMRNCNILLLGNIDKEKQIANLCYNMVQVGDTSLMPHYFREVAKAVYNQNIRRWTWDQILSGDF